jgi:hypothetical protein
MTVGVRQERYYVALGRGTDYLVRCADCKALQLTEELSKHGSCECGNKRFREITTLTEQEAAQIEAMDFPYKAEFLAEFAPRA